MSVDHQQYCQLKQNGTGEHIAVRNHSPASGIHVCSQLQLRPDSQRRLLLATGDETTTWTAYGSHEAPREDPGISKGSGILKIMISLENKIASVLGPWGG